LLHDAESMVPTAHPSLRLANPRTVDLLLLRRALDELEEAASARRRDAAFAIVRRLVPEYGGDDTRSAVSG
jgi:hypothetical protein